QRFQFRAQLGPRPVLERSPHQRAAYYRAVAKTAYGFDVIRRGDAETHHHGERGGVLDRGQFLLETFLELRLFTGDAGTRDVVEETAADFHDFLEACRRRGRRREEDEA